MNQRYVLVKSDGTVRTLVEPLPLSRNDRIRRLVGDNCEPMDLSDTVQAYLNHGDRPQLRYNHLASTILKNQVFGDVVFGSNDRDFTGLSGEDVRELTEELNAVGPPPDDRTIVENLRQLIARFESVSLNGMSESEILGVIGNFQDGESGLLMLSKETPETAELASVIGAIRKDMAAVAAKHGVSMS